LKETLKEIRAYGIKTGGEMQSGKNAALTRKVKNE